MPMTIFFNKSTAGSRRMFDFFFTVILSEMANRHSLVLFTSVLRIAQIFFNQLIFCLLCHEAQIESFLRLSMSSKRCTCSRLCSRSKTDTFILSQSHTHTNTQESLNQNHVGCKISLSKEVIDEIRCHVRFHILSIAKQQFWALFSLQCSKIYNCNVAWHMTWQLLNRVRINASQTAVLNQSMK